MRKKIIIKPRNSKKGHNKTFKGPAPKIRKYRFWKTKTDTRKKKKLNSFVSIQEIKYEINYPTKPSQMVSVIFF